MKALLTFRPEPDRTRTGLPEVILVDPEAVNIILVDADGLPVLSGDLLALVLPHTAVDRDLKCPE